MRLPAVISCRIAALPVVTFPWKSTNTNDVWKTNIRKSSGHLAIVKTRKPHHIPGVAHTASIIRAVVQAAQGGGGVRSPAQRESNRNKMEMINNPCEWPTYRKQKKIQSPNPLATTESTMPLPIRNRQQTQQGWTMAFYVCRISQKPSATTSSNGPPSDVFWLNPDYVWTWVNRYVSP